MPFELQSLPPWLQTSWASLQPLRQRPPAELLLVSPETGDAEGLAALFAQWLLCAVDGDSPCGQCRSCRELRAGVHPDYLRLARPEDKKDIGIDAIRGANDWSSRTARGTRRVLHIAQAELLNRSASNAFLKTLEEPSAGVCILLSCSRLHSLPITLRSRCMRLALRPPTRDEFGAWLGAQGWAQSAMQDAWTQAPADVLAALHKGEGGLEAVDRWRGAWRLGVTQGQTLDAASALDAEDWPAALRWLQRMMVAWAADGSAAQALGPAWQAAIRLRAMEGIALNRLLAAEELIILLRRAYQAHPYEGDLKA